VAALKRETGARVVMLGPEPIWKRGLPNEVLRYYMLHRALIPPRTNDEVSSDWYDAELRSKLGAQGAEYISAWRVFCNAEGCLTRLGDRASDVTASDMIHLTEKGSTFLVRAVIDRVLDGKAAAPQATVTH